MVCKKRGCAKNTKCRDVRPFFDTPSCRSPVLGRVISRRFYCHLLYRLLCSCGSGVFAYGDYIVVVLLVAAEPPNMVGTGGQPVFMGVVCAVRPQPRSNNVALEIHGLSPVPTVFGGSAANHCLAHTSSKKYSFLNVIPFFAQRVRNSSTIPVVA